MQSIGIKRRALCIGIEYWDHADVSEATGTHTDARRLATFLHDKFGYEVEVMVDDRVGLYQPTKKSIYAAVQRLIKDARAEDRLVFHFSGHGTQIKNLDGTERDDLDEVILPVDCKINNDYPDEHDRNHWFEDSRIIDDELNAWFLPNLPSGCRLTVLIDACHCGTAFDLKYNYSYVPRCQVVPACGMVCESPTTEIFPDEMLSTLTERSTSTSKLTKDFPQARSFRTRTLRVSECSGVRKRCRSLTICPITDYPRQSHQDGPVVTFWAPCADEDLAYGTPNGGLLVTTFMDYFNHVRENLPTNRDLLCFLHHKLREKIDQANANHPNSQIKAQEPQFGTNMPFVLDQPVVL